MSEWKQTKRFLYAATNLYAWNVSRAKLIPFGRFNQITPDVLQQFRYSTAKQHYLTLPFV